MPVSQNKGKVLEAALKLFNRDGVVNVRLQHISDEAIVSVGNMAYHFKNKDAIVQALWEQMAQEQRVLLQEFKILPLFEDLERLLQAIFRLQQTYNFFYLDTLEVLRAYSDVREAYLEHQTWQAFQIELMMQFNVSRGAFIPELEAGYFNSVANLFWMTADLWMYRQTVCQRPSDDYRNFRSALWNLFLPLYTEMGKKEFVQINTMFLGDML